MNSASSRCPRSVARGSAAVEIDVRSAAPVVLAIGSVRENTRGSSSVVPEAHGTNDVWEEPD